MLRHAPLLLLALPLAACGGDEKEGTHISFKADGEDGNMTASTEANGQMAISLPGFEGKLKLPKIALKAENFDVNGVRLYPNSKIVNFDVDARDKGAGKKDEGTVKVQFESPAPADTVRGWFQDEMRKRAFKVERRGDGLSGTTNDGDPFTLELASAGAGAARGTLTIRDSGD